MASQDFGSNFFICSHIKPFLASSIIKPSLFSLSLRTLTSYWSIWTCADGKLLPYLVSLTTKYSKDKYSLSSTILFLGWFMFKCPITRFFGYCNLHLCKASKSYKPEWSKQVICVWGHAYGVCASPKYSQ